MYRENNKNLETHSGGSENNTWTPSHAKAALQSALSSEILEGLISDNHPENFEYLEASSLKTSSMTSEIEDAKNSTQKNSGMSGSPGSSSTPKRHQAFSPESSDLVDFIANFDFRKSEEGIIVVRCAAPEKTRSLSIPSSLLGAPIFRIEKEAFAGRRELAKISIPEGVTQIGSRAFADCPNLGSVFLPSSLISIGAEAFKNCPSLKSINLQGCELEIGTSAFADCTGLKKITILKGLETIPAGCFAGCENLREVEFSEDVKSIREDAFRDCASLRSVEFPSHLAEIGDSAFRGCSGLQSLDLPNSIVSLAELAFANCTSLETIKLPDKLTFLPSGAFSDCLGLRSVKVGRELLELGSTVFSGCQSLKEILLPASLKKMGSRVFCGCTHLEAADLSQCGIEELGSETFSGCASLKRLFFPISNLRKLGKWTFKGCRSLTEVTLPSSLVTLGNGLFEDCYGLQTLCLKGIQAVIPDNFCTDCYSLSEITLEDTIEVIGNNAFSGCRSLTCVKLPQNLLKLGERAFFNCANLQNVFCGESLTGIGREAFMGCKNMESINLPASLILFNGEHYENIFDNEASKLVIHGKTNTEAAKYAHTCRIKFYNSVLDALIDNDTIGAADNEELLDEESNLTPEDVIEEESPRAPTDDATPVKSVVTRVYGLKVNSTSYRAIISKGDWIVIRHKAFERKSDTRANVPLAVHLQDINHVGNRAFCNRNVIFLDCSDSLISIGKAAFWGCSLMQKIHWSKNLSFIDKSAFWGCYSLKSLELPESVQFIDNWAFFGCSGLEELHLPPYLVSLGSYVFAYCTSLTYVVIPSGTKSLGTGLFFGCTALQKVVIPPSVKQFGPELSQFAPIFGQGDSLNSNEVPKTNVTVVCQKDSAAYEYAQHFGLNYELVKFESDLPVSNSLPKSGNYMLSGLGVSDAVTHYGHALSARPQLSPRSPLTTASTSLPTPSSQISEPVTNQAVVEDSRANSDSPLLPVDKDETDTSLSNPISSDTQNSPSSNETIHSLFDSKLSRTTKASHPSQTVRLLKPQAGEHVNIFEAQDADSGLFSQLQAAYEILDNIDFLKIWSSDYATNAALGKRALNSSLLFSSIGDILASGLPTGSSSSTPEQNQEQAQQNNDDVQSDNPFAQERDIYAAAGAFLDSVARVLANGGLWTANAEIVASSRIRLHSASSKGNATTSAPKTTEPQKQSEPEVSTNSELKPSNTVPQPIDPAPANPKPASAVPYRFIPALSLKTSRGTARRFAKSASMRRATTKLSTPSPSSSAPSTPSNSSPSIALTSPCVSTTDEDTEVDKMQTCSPPEQLNDSAAAQPSSAENLDKPTASVYQAEPQDNESEFIGATSSSDESPEINNPDSLNRGSSPSVPLIPPDTENESNPSDNPLYSNSSQVPPEHSTPQPQVDQNFSNKEGVTLAKVSQLNQEVVKLPNELNGRPVVGVADNFMKGDDALEEIYLGENLKIIGCDAFRSCSSLRRVDFPPSLLTIGSGAFRSCDRLRRIQMPSGVVELGSRAFCACSHLIEVHLSANLLTIGEAAFVDCQALESLAIPNLVESIGARAFMGCRSLHSLYVPSTCTKFGNPGDDKLFDISTNLVIYTPKDSPAWNYAQAHNLCCCEASEENWQELAAQRKVKQTQGNSKDSNQETDSTADKEKEAECLDKKAKYLKRMTARKKGRKH